MAMHHQEQEEEQEEEKEEEEEEQGEGSSSGCHRSLSSSGGTKRPFEKLSANGYGDAGSREEKRRKRPPPSLASVVFEAVRMESITKICSTLEPFLRRVIGEEVERALGRLIPIMHGSRLPLQLHEPHSSNLQLVFKNKLSHPLFTGAKVEGDQGLPIRVALQDATTGQIVKTGSESMAKLEVVVLDGDFTNEDGWTAEQFEQHVVKERDGKRPLLTGDLNVALKEGVGSLGELMFTDNSSWIRSRKFRLGVRVSHGYMEGIRIKECKTEAFIVKDHRGELYKKHYPPALTDEVWRLDKIGKDGAFHKRLQESGIKTVQDFLRSYEMDKQKLRNVLGGGMSNKMWEGTVEHAKTCVLNDKLYVFNADSVHNVLVVFNSIHKLMGVTLSGQYKSVESLTENEKVHVDGLVKVAYANWHTVTECGSGFLATEAAYKSLNIHYSANEGMRMIGCSGDLDEHSSRNGHSVAKPPVDSAIFHHLNYNTEVILGDDSQGQLINRDDQTLNTENDTQNVLTSNRASFIGNDPSLLHHGTSQQIYQQNYVEWQYSPGTHINQCLIEEGIHGGRQVNDDMQQLLRSSYAPFSGSFRLYDHESYIPGGYIQPHTVSYGVRSSGRACIGWLKIKAALWWGIFIRKIVHEKAVRRAQLEELTDF